MTRHEIRRTAPYIGPPADRDEALERGQMMYEAMRQKDDAQWIPVAHALPPKAKRQDTEGLTHSEEVLITDGKYVYVGRAEENEGAPGILTWPHSNGYACSNVTHWAPLPNLPK